MKLVPANYCYRMQFNKGDDGLVANDLFQALVSEYNAEQVADGWHKLNNTACDCLVKNEGAYLYIRPLVNSADASDDNCDEILDMICNGAAEYGPAFAKIKMIDGLKLESYNPISKRGAFKAMRHGHLKLFKVNEALQILNSIGAKLIKEDKG